MRRPFPLALVAFALLAVSALAAMASPAQAEPQIYAGATLLDPASETETPNAWVLVDEGRIVEVGQGGPPARLSGVARRDFSGHFLLPGLIDSHAHIVLGPISARVEDGKLVVSIVDDPAVVEHNGRMLLAYGVTTVRDTGEAVDRAMAYRREERAGRIVGPEALTAGDIIDRSPMGFEGLVAALPEAGSVEDIVAAQARAGADYIKLYAHLDEADLIAGIAAAKAAGLKTIGHLETISWTRAAELGIDSLTHMMPIHPDLLPADGRDAYRTSLRPGTLGFFEWYEQVDLDGPEITRMIRVLKERGVHVDATLIAFHFAYFGDDQTLRERDLALAPPSLAANWLAGFRFDLGWSADDHRRAQAVWPKVLKLTRMLYEAGVPMTVGTDMANPWVAPGVSLSREMELHVEAGIPPWAVLRMATTDAARILGIGERTGRIAPGLEADAVFLRADPRQDMAALREVAAVLDDGVLLDPEALMGEAVQRD